MSRDDTFATIERLQWIRAVVEAIEELGQNDNANRLLDLVVHLCADWESQLEDLVARADQHAEQAVDPALPATDQ